MEDWISIPWKSADVQESLFGVGASEFWSYPPSSTKGSSGRGVGGVGVLGGRGTGRLLKVVMVAHTPCVLTRRWCAWESVFQMQQLGVE